MLFSVCLLVSLHLCYGELYCLTCSEVVSPRHCKSIRRCNEGQVCFTEKYKSITGETLYNVGCQASRRCESRRVNPLLQRLTSSRRYVYDPDTTECIECCSTDACNRDGCGSPDYPDVRGPACFDCQQTRDPRLCRSVAVCMEGEVCQTHLRTTFGDKIYTMACAPDFVCSQMYMKADRCNQCCKTDFCNKNLCDPLEEQYGFQTVLDVDQGRGILIFSSVLTNVGHGYDPLTGYFTPRTNGTYLFTWNLESYGQPAVGALELNGYEIATTQTQMSTDQYYSGSSFAILNLNPGDNVYFRLLNGTVSKTFTMFNGWKKNSDKLPALYVVCSFGNCSINTQIITNNDVYDSTTNLITIKPGFYLLLESSEGKLEFGLPSRVNSSEEIAMYYGNSDAFGLVFLSNSQDYLPCSHIEEQTTLAEKLTMRFFNPYVCFDYLISLGPSITGIEILKVTKGGLFVFAIQVKTFGEDILSSLRINNVEMLQMSVKGKEYYGYPSYNDATIYPVFHLQTNDEITFKNISGSFIGGYFYGILINDD